MDVVSTPLLGDALRGLVIGVSIAAPVGPIGLLCIRRTLADGTAVGFASGLGAASADAVYGAIAGFGLAAASLLLDAQTPLRLAGGLMLLWLAVGTFRSRPPEREAAASVAGRGLAGAFASTFLLTLTNPATILSFAAVFGALGLAGQGGSAAAAAALVSGVFVGSAVWWLALSSGVGLLRTRVTPTMMRWINRISAAVLGGFGLAALVSAL